MTIINAEPMKEVQEIQLAVLDGLTKQCKDSSHEIVPKDEKIIKGIQEAKLEDLSSIMGNFLANRLKNFCTSVDLDHPTIQDIVKSVFNENTEFNAILKETLGFISNNLCKEMPNVLNLLRESFTKAKSIKDVRHTIYKPPIRSLKSRELRDECRTKKKSKLICLKEWGEKNKNWNDYPSSFLNFARMNDSHIESMQENKNRAELMKQHGMISMAESFLKRNEIVNNFVGETYAGFVKVKMVDAAIILAKSHNCHFKEENKSIYFTREFFGNTKFWLEPHSSYTYKDCRGPEPVMTNKYMKTEEYNAPETFSLKVVAYPLHEFTIEKSQHVKEVLDSVESHSDILSKALFDQFWVIVPGVSISSSEESYRNKEGEVTNIQAIRKNDIAELYSNKELAEKSLMFWLAEQKAIHPIVLGEKDGKCYFLTYWH